jgi:hypothetical protein
MQSPEIFQVHTDAFAPSTAAQIFTILFRRIAQLYENYLCLVLITLSFRLELLTEREVNNISIAILFKLFTTP